MPSTFGEPEGARLINTLLEWGGVALISAAAAALISPWAVAAVVGLYLIYVAREAE